MRLQLPPAVLGSGATLRGNVTASLAATGRAVCGNLTLTAEILDADRRVLYKQVHTVMCIYYMSGYVGRNPKLVSSRLINFHFLLLGTTPARMDIY